jgi:four helix bundle protein
VSGVEIKTDSLSWIRGVPVAFRSYEHLRVFRKAEKLADLVWQIVAGWQHFEKISMGGQLVTAADSIGANMAESAGRGTDKESQRFIRIARGSLYELKLRLRRAVSRGLTKEDDAKEIQCLIEKLGPALNACLNSFTRS